MPDALQPYSQQEADPANDAQLLRDLRFALEHDQIASSGDIRAVVQHAVAILSGSAPHQDVKVAARAAALRVPGIRDVCDDIRVADRGSGADQEILARVQAMLGLDAAVAPERLIVSVDKGHVTIGGHVEWPAQASAAVAAVRRVRGVKGVTNSVHVDGLPSLTIMRAGLVTAFRDAGEGAAAGIDIVVSGRSVRLSGKVRSMNERELAERTIGALHGVDRVENHLAVI